jgi:hypothetical protein
VKRLEIVYDGKVLFDRDVVHFSWQEVDNEITLKAGDQQPPNLGDVLRDAVKNRSLQQTIPVASP